MMRQGQVWQLLSDSLRQHLPAVLLCVVESNGSSPGRQGFCMAVNAAGAMEGSIGGGIMEHKLVALCRERLLHDAPDEGPMVRQQVHRAAAQHRSGMICSGEQTVVLYRIQPGDEMIIEQIRDGREQGLGSFVLSNEGLHFSDTAAPQSHSWTFHNEAAWRYTERLGYRDHLHIVGGGHCALALSQLMRGLDFYIHLYEDRPALHTVLRNDFAHEKKLVDYNELGSLIPSGPEHYVMIMTFGYRSDKIALKSLLHLDPGYMGMMGSKAKVAQLFEELAQEGADPARLARVHAPAGLSINSRTPEEIAVSMAAQIILVRSERAAD